MGEIRIGAWLRMATDGGAVAGIIVGVERLPDGTPLTACVEPLDGSGPRIVRLDGRECVGAEAVA